MAYTVGSYLAPNDQDDNVLDDFDEAYEKMSNLSEEQENLVVGLFVQGEDAAEYVAIDGAVFKAE